MPEIASLLATPRVLEPQPADTARALPAGFYTDAASVELDRRAVFARSWQLVAHAGQLSGGGDHVVAKVAGVPILVVRGADGVLRALHNVCRHRAGPLATCDGRGARRLHCQYHGWTYDLEGRLLSAPEMSGARDFDVAEVRLPAARVGEWQGLVFVALEDAPPPLEEMLAGMDARLGARSLADYRFHRRVDYEVACNWKVYVENYLEGYHIPHLHPELNRMLDYRSYVTELAPWYSLQYSPLESDTTLYGQGEALYCTLWPNTLLNILPDRLQTNVVLPLAVDRCRVVFDYFYPAGTADVDPRHAVDHEFSDRVQRQDEDICASVQRGLASGSWTPGRLNPQREAGVHHFQELLRRAWREAATPR